MRPFPFRGIVDRARIPSTEGMTAERWGNIAPQEVRFAHLFLTQSHVNVLAIYGVSDRITDAYPHVVADHTGMYLENGHNRVLRAALTGLTDRMNMRVLELEP